MMEKLINYVESQLHLAQSKDTAASEAENLMNAAFGACKLFMILFPEQKQEVVSRWDTKWYPACWEILCSKWT